MARTLNDNRTNRTHARRWMTSELQQDPDYYLDCGEVNATLLGENYAQEHDLYADDYSATIPDWVFDVAAEVRL